MMRKKASNIRSHKIELIMWNKIIVLTFEVLTPVTKKNTCTIFLDVNPCSLLKVNGRFVYIIFKMSQKNLHTVWTELKLWQRTGTSFGNVFTTCWIHDIKYHKASRGTKRSWNNLNTGIWNMYKILFEKLQRKTPLGKWRCRLNNNIKTELQEAVFEGVGGIKLA
jgi:hypothetical protein